MSDVSLIGCRISIISKAKIRYEGYLDSLDCDTPNEPVITLSKVWSFGTEDRPCERPVAPRNEEYNQVVFRGRDLEDICLVQSSVFLNEDSAIVSVAPRSGTSVMHGTDKTHIDLPPNDRVTSSVPSTRVPLVSGLQSVSLDMLSQNTARPGASTPQSQAVNSRPGPIGTLQTDRAQQPDTRGPRPFGDGRSDGDVGGLFHINVPHSGRIIPGDAADDTNKQRLVLGSSSRFDSTQVGSNRGGYLRSAPREDPANLPDKSNGQFMDYFRQRRPLNNHWSGNQRGFRLPPGGPHRWGSRGGFHGWPRSRADVNSTISQCTFLGEYDYEKANAELAAELEKISISVSKPGSSVDGDTGKGDESGGSVTGDDAACYDKSRSFFDTLSSEMMDKANGVAPQGMNARNKRLLNSATFGTTTSHFPRRGGYQGRGSYANYSYGQRRGGGGGTSSSGGGFWRSVENSTTRASYNTGRPLPMAGDVK